MVSFTKQPVPAVRLKCESTGEAHYDPAGHTKQLDAPMFDWNIPSAQAVQAEAPEAEYFPTGQ